MPDETAPSEPDAEDGTIVSAAEVFVLDDDGTVEAVIDQTETVVLDDDGTVEAVITETETVMLDAAGDVEAVIEEVETVVFDDAGEVLKRECPAGQAVAGDCSANAGADRLFDYRVPFAAGLTFALPALRHRSAILTNERGLGFGHLRRTKQESWGNVDINRTQPSRYTRLYRDPRLVST